MRRRCTRMYPLARRGASARARSVLHIRQILRPAPVGAGRRRDYSSGPGGAGMRAAGPGFPECAVASEYIYSRRSGDSCTMPRKTRARTRARSMRRRKVVLITGGAGFIGSHLCDFFLQRDFEVICVDNLLTGSADNLAHIRSPQFHLSNLDVTKYIYVQGPVDYILH